MADAFANESQTQYYRFAQVFLNDDLLLLQG
jgi:hypothetical protein